MADIHPVVRLKRWSNYMYDGRSNIQWEAPKNDVALFLLLGHELAAIPPTDSAELAAIENRLSMYRMAKDLLDELIASAQDIVRQGSSK